MRGVRTWVQSAWERVKSGPMGVIGSSAEGISGRQVVVLLGISLKQNGL